MFWDDYRPVQYAQSTVEVGTVLSPFNGLPLEVQMPQNVHDGTLGVASQAPSACLLRRPRAGSALSCSSADGELSATVENCADVEPCAVHMCRWIVEGAQAADAAAALRSSLPAVLLTASHEAVRPGLSGVAAVAGVAELGREAKLPEGAVSALHAELAALGAAHVAELEVEDWEGMAAFWNLKKLEQRRLLKALRAA